MNGFVIAVVNGIGFGIGLAVASLIMHKLFGIGFC